MGTRVAINEQPVPMSAKFGRRPFPRSSVILFTVWQNNRKNDRERSERSHNLRLVGGDKHGNDKANINVNNFHSSLTTIVRAQNHGSKIANITDTISIKSVDDTIAVLAM